MLPITNYLVGYLIPLIITCLCAYWFYYRNPAQKPSYLGPLILHAGLLLSIALCTTVLSSKPAQLQYNIGSIVVFVITILIAWLWAGKAGLAYAASSLVQQACILAAALLILPVYAPLAVSMLIGAPFALAHLTHSAQWKLKLPITFIWGIGCVLIYAWRKDLFITSSIHILGGVYLLKRGIIYAKTSKMPNDVFGRNSSK